VQGDSREKEPEGDFAEIFSYLFLSFFQRFKNCFYPLKCKPFITNTNMNFLAAG